MGKPVSLSFVQIHVLLLEIVESLRTTPFAFPEDAALRLEGKDVVPVSVETVGCLDGGGPKLANNERVGGPG
jgi:hypothetical protein